MNSEALAGVSQEKSQRQHDPLLECLLSLAKREHRQCSATSLVAGLPLVDNRLSPDLFVRAAKRAGLSAKVAKRTLAEIPSLVLPVVLLLEDNQAVVLLKREDSGDLLLLDTATDGRVTLSADELAKSYTGYCIFCKPEHRYDERTLELARQHDGHWFWRVIGKSWRIYRDVLVASVLINLFALANPLFVMNVYDRVVPNAALETLWVLAIGVMLVYGFDLILKLLRNYFIEVAGKKADVQLSAYIFERVLGARYEEHPQSVGVFASQLREFESIRSFITSSTVTAFVDLPFTVLFLVVIAYLGGPLVLVPLSAIPIILIFSWYMQRKLGFAVEETYRSSAQKNATLVETLTALETVKLIGAEGRLQRSWEKSVGHLAQWGQRVKLLTSTTTAGAGMVQQVAGVVVVIVGVYQIAERDLTMGGLIACVMLAARAMAPMAQVSGLMVNFHQTKTALESLDAIVNKPQERDDDKPFVARSQLKGKITFDKVTFSYPGEKQTAVEQVSFTIDAGEHVAIIGRIGSGKTTLQKLMTGLYRPSQGAVLIDGVDQSQIDPADLRAHIGSVPQDVTLFFGSVRENILYGNPMATDEDVIRAAQISGVSEFVNAHPNGLDRQVGERGSALSGGQRQSIAIARAVLNQPPIYILDEPSTAMDNSTEERLKRHLTQTCDGKTLIVVTHKTSLLTLVDRIIVLDQGRLIADGPKDSVLEALKKGQLRVSPAH
ncbi:type I secretion system permease/ATPase [Simiduia curdlanivorans]|uniref:Type I secretion system permease/ATPase n=1 Tax=Simiduia curdlanivorans TaxID=1492769 RepID=A0ABV8V4K0_9GAMM|nr:type I secretion system permease/ATPase [Simiduia curdlanivorans]MDN3639304.1 type I secretion system permease/ATPase [Simiduia curdlanivorans]